MITQAQITSAIDDSIARLHAANTFITPTALYKDLESKLWDVYYNDADVVAASQTCKTIRLAQDELQEIHKIYEY